MRERKSFNELSATGKLVRKRQEAGKPLPPTMQRKTIEYVKAKYWNSLQQRTFNAKSPQLTPRNMQYLKKQTLLLMTKTEFCMWVDENWHKFQELYEQGKTPSVDRIYNNGHYSLDNIQVIDLKENMAKDRVKALVATPINGGPVLEFASGVDAEKFGFDRKLVSRSAKKGGSHAGYKWQFKEIM